jgi:UDP-N-acetylglucosamine 2-epimerase (hydrolysing)
MLMGSRVRVGHPRRKVGFVFGTRPEAIKLAPVIAACREVPGLEPLVCVTAQHRELLDQVLGFFGIEPDEDLDLMSRGQTLSGFASQALSSLSLWLDRHELAALVVQGDTTTTLMAGLAAYHRQIPVAHVEAGLRTYRLYEPWPEEGNRRLTDHLARWHFAPTESAAANLLSEGLGPGSVHVTGNTVVDAVLHVWELAIQTGVAPPAPIGPGQRVITATVHRRENFGEPLRRICRALRLVVEREPNVDLVIPVHPNPNVRPVVHQLLGGRERIHLIEPPGYLEFVALMAASDLVVTDSGGVQEEAPILGKPTLVLRRVTERPEGVTAGAAIVVGDRVETIVPEIRRLLGDADYYRTFARSRSPYGDGHASQRIAHILRDGIGAADPGALRPAVPGRIAS